MNDGFMLQHTINLKRRPRLDSMTAVRLYNLRMMADDDIKYLDIPELAHEKGWRRVGLPHKKQSITLRVDADVLDFFKSTGPGYQGRMNTVLRAFVEAQAEQGVIVR